VKIEDGLLFGMKKIPRRMMYIHFLLGSSSRKGDEKKKKKEKKESFCPNTVHPKIGKVKNE